MIAARVAAAMVAAVTLLVAGAGTAMADPQEDPSDTLTPIVTNDDDISLAWDGPITALDWRNKGYAVAGDTFVGDPVSVPGDRVQRSAVVVNDGPSDAHATVEILDVKATDPKGTVNDELQDCIHLIATVDDDSYDATWRQAIASADADGVSWEETVPVPQGASFRLSVGMSFPIDETRGRDMGDPSQELSFRVQVVMVGDVPSTPGPPKVETGGVATGTAPTGGSVVGAGEPYGLMGAALAVAALPAGFAWVRRVRRDEAR